LGRCGRRCGRICVPASNKTGQSAIRDT
jgi:hypothetical protein